MNAHVLLGFKNANGRKRQTQSDDQSSYELKNHVPVLQMSDKLVKQIRGQM